MAEQNIGESIMSYTPVQLFMAVGKCRYVCVLFCVFVCVCVFFVCPSEICWCAFLRTIGGKQTKQTIVRKKYSQKAKFMSYTPPKKKHYYCAPLELG